MVKLPLYRRTAAAGALASLVGPVCCYFWHLGDSDYVIGRLGTAFWPTLHLFVSFLPPHEVGEGEGQEAIVLMLSLVTNAVVYVVVFSALWGIAWFIRARFDSSRNERTI